MRKICLRIIIICVSTSFLIVSCQGNVNVTEPVYSEQTSVVNESTTSIMSTLEYTKTIVSNPTKTVTPSHYPTMNPTSLAKRNEIIEECQILLKPVIHALELYKSKNGEYPIIIEELIPLYIQELPVWTNGEEVEYLTHINPDDPYYFYYALSFVLERIPYENSMMATVKFCSFTYDKYGGQWGIELSDIDSLD